MWPRLFRTAYALTGSIDVAEELVQDALVQLFVHWRKVQQADSREAYARRVVVNLATSRWRSRSRRREVLVPDAGADRSVAGFEHEVAESESLWTAIQALPPRQRAVVVLRYYEDLSERQIADVLAIAPGTVKSLGSAAMTKLRVTFTDQADHQMGARG